MDKKNIAVIGLGKFGASVAEELSRIGADVLAIDKNEEVVADVAEFVACAMKADVCDVSTMATLGLSNMDAVVIAITSDMNASVMSTLLAAEAGVPVILAKAQDEVHSRVLKRVGATRVIIPEKESGVRVASMLAGSFLDFVELSDRIRMIEMEPKSEWIGKTLRELNLRKRERINIVALRRGEELITSPDPDKALPKGITLLVIVDRSDIVRLRGD